MDVSQDAIKSQPPTPSKREPSGDDGAVWVVMGSTGEYSDRSEWTVYAFRTEPEAQSYVQFLTEKRQQLGIEARGRDEREAVEVAMRAFDPEFSEDYTGTRWWAVRVDIAPTPATDGLGEEE